MSRYPLKGSQALMLKNEDGSDYLGPLELFCQDCEKLVTCIGRPVGPPKVTKLGESCFLFEQQLRRHCPECLGIRLRLQISYITCSFTIDAPKEPR